MVTALGQAAERLIGHDAGADDFLTKPVDHATLTVRVRSLIRLKRLLDEWRARSETARVLGLGAGAPAVPSVIGARAVVIDHADAAAEALEQALGCEGVLATRAHTPAEATSLAPAGLAADDRCRSFQSGE